MDKLHLGCISENGDVVNIPVYAWKLEVFERDNGECRICSIDTDVDVHLIDESKERSVNNGIVLCNSCYKEYKRHLNGLSNWKRLESFFNSKGKTLRVPIINNTGHK